MAAAPVERTTSEKNETVALAATWSASINREQKEIRVNMAKGT